MSTWKYNQNGQTIGPVQTVDLRSLLSNGTLPGDTLVLKEGSANWLPATAMPELADSIPTGGAAPSSSPGAQQLGSGTPPLMGGAPTPDAADVEKNKVFAILAYIGILFLVPLLAAPDSKFARYHTNQGLILFLATIIATAASMVLMFIPFIGCIASLAGLAIGVGALVLMILGIINAANGQCKPLPYIGHYQLLK